MKVLQHNKMLTFAIFNRHNFLAIQLLAQLISFCEYIKVFAVLQGLILQLLIMLIIEPDASQKYQLFVFTKVFKYQPNQICKIPCCPKYLAFQHFTAECNAFCEEYHLIFVQTTIHTTKDSFKCCQPKLWRAKVFLKIDYILSSEVRR